jgi:hypothetical protein
MSNGTVICALFIWSIHLSIRFFFRYFTPHIWGAPRQFPMSLNNDAEAETMIGSQVFLPSLVR